MGSESGQANFGFNPLIFWQNYVSKWSEANLVFYDNAIKVSEYWFKIFWEPWLKGARKAQKETAKVE